MAYTTSDFRRGLKIEWEGKPYEILEYQHVKVSKNQPTVRTKLKDLTTGRVLEVNFRAGDKFEKYSLEYILDNHFDIATSIMKKIRPIEQFNNYLQYGCYPFYQESLVDYPQKLLEVINLTIDSDLSGIYNIDPSKLDKLKKIIYMLCVTKPYELNISKLSSSVGASWPTLSKYLQRLDSGSLLHILRGGQGMRAVNKPDKLLLDNPNLFTVLCATPNIGSIRESFFVSQVSISNQVHYHDRGDFILNDDIVFEIGGASKSDSQLDNKHKGYVVSDDIEIGAGNKIPLWLFRFLY